MTEYSPAELAGERAVRAELERYYSAGEPPWDTKVSPPELESIVAGPDALPPGRALELGCGTATNAIYLARHGWDVDAVDMIDRAIELARSRVDAAGADVRLHLGDATRLDALDLTGHYDLFFDLGCYCGIPTHLRDGYATGVTRRAAPGARLLMFGYGPEAFEHEMFDGVTTEELRTRFAGWELSDVSPGTNPVPTFWFTLRRVASGG